MDAPSKGLSPSVVNHDTTLPGATCRNELTERIANHDWTRSVLGTPESWPRTLRTMVALMENSKVPMWLGWGPSLCMIYNAAYIELLGNKHPDAMGQPIREVWSEIWPDISELIATTMSGEGICADDMPLLVKRKDVEEQAYFSFSYSPVRDEGDHIQGMVCTVWETTKKVNYRRELQDSQARFLALTKASANVIYRASADWSELIVVEGQGLLANVGAPNRSWLDGYVPLEDRARVWQAIQRAVADKSTYEQEHRFVRVDGSVGWTMSRAVPMLDAAGEVVEWFGTATDVTSRHEAETALAEAQKGKDRFLAMLAHELRNPLAPIRNGLQVLNSRLDSSQPGGVLATLNKQVDHLVRLVDDLMDVARINTGVLQVKPSRIELGSAIQSAIALSSPAIESGKHALVVQLPSDPLFVRGDEVRLAQAFSNLLNNAARYTPTPGRIEVSVLSEIGHAVVHVADNGIGIELEDQARLFALFDRLHPRVASGQGLGVGLALTKLVLDAHGATIAVRSGGTGKGSCFTVSIPLSTEVTVDVAGRTEPAPIQGLRVLVVDDNRDAADSLGLLVDLIGCRSTVFNSGFAALEALDAVAPQVALLDVGMPEMDGCALARAIRSIDRHRDVVLIAVTGWGQPQDRARTTAAGFDHHLVKPISIEQLQPILAGIDKLGATKSQQE